MENNEWKWHSSIWDFLGSVSWTMVVREARNRGELTNNILTNPEINKQKATEYGINDVTLAKEMIRIGKECLLLLGE